MPTANRKNLTHASVVMARVGNWSARVNLDNSTKLVGAVTLDIDGQAFVGWADPVISGVFAGRSQARVVGGKGGLGKELPAKSYANGPALSQVLGDILRECGETLSSTADADVLGKRFGKWHREKGPALRAIEALLEVAGADWRMLADGTVWVGTDAYPVQKLTHQLIDENWAEGVITIAPQKPELRPGVTFNGLRVEEVRHYLTPRGLRTEAAAESLAGHFRRLLGDVNRRVDYSREYSARVARQNSDNTVQVVLDDVRVKSPGLDRVPIRPGVPGTIKVASGARCKVGFENGDPSRPYAEGWETNACLSVAIADGTRPAAFVGATVTVILPPTVAFAGTVGGSPATGLLTFTPPLTTVGIIDIGNPKALV